MENEKCHHNLKKANNGQTFSEEYKLYLQRLKLSTLIKFDIYIRALDTYILWIGSHFCQDSDLMPIWRQTSKSMVIYQERDNDI